MLIFTYMKNKNKSGFTLVELLVVVAVIGLLAAVVAVSTTAAKSKGADAAAKRDLASIRIQANLYYTNNSNAYGAITALCSAGMYSADTIMANAITHATTNSTAIACNTGPTDQIFAVAVTLKTGTGYYCVDSANAGKFISTATASSGLVGAGATFALNTTTGLCI
jgi:prepilin-type N-terminal cleavage/methylation domain-containing protein